MDRVMNIGNNLNLNNDEIFNEINSHKIEVNKYRETIGKLNYTQEAH